MKKIFLTVFLLSIVGCHPALAAESVGFRQTTVRGAEIDRPLSVALWYPTDIDQPTVVVGETPAFYGLPVIRDATVSVGAHPLILLSHGYGGSWRNLAWLAMAFAGKGYVVAAPDHPGTTTFDRRPEEAAKPLQRPQDISRVIDDLLEHPNLAGEIDRERIAAIGHSLGGWTVMELAGGRFDPDLISNNCVQQFGPVSCKLFAEIGLRGGANATQLQAADLRDARIRAVVSLDLGPARGFTEQSLAAVRIPVLLIAAGSDIAPDVAIKAKIAATNKDSVYLAGRLPTAITTYRQIPDALHFSFMQICKPGAAEMIDRDTPGDGIVCRDGGARDREAIHQQVLDLVSDFLAKAMPRKNGRAAN